MTCAVTPFYLSVTTAYSDSTGNIIIDTLN
jgi:hypothetical protein